MIGAFTNVVIFNECLTKEHIHRDFGQEATSSAVIVNIQTT
jgi:hypothetical protein